MIKLLTPLLLLFISININAQVYKFNRQIIMHLEGNTAKNISSNASMFIIEVTPKKVILKRLPTNSNESFQSDTLTRNSVSKTIDFKKIITKDGSCILIFGNELISMRTKEKQGKRTEIFFYNHENNNANYIFYRLTRLLK